MAKRNGTITVNTNDILPIIKKWLYSEHDIFLRELVSNACDAITKRGTLARNKNRELPDGKVDVLIDKKEKTLTITDNGIGMSEDEVEKYIAQLAFSGAKDFVEKMKDAGADNQEDIIGKFGLGFYSAFMVADKVEINTLSMEDNAHSVKWTCEGDTEFTFEDSDKTDVGTEIKLFLNDESAEFLELFKTRQVLTNYCQFMPYPVELIDGQAEVKEGETPTTDIINDVTPLWKKDPNTLKDEDYKEFYRKLYPMDSEPLFWLHLNVDHPFTLQGILYFPKLNPTKPLNENNIKLYSKQVFVSDNVKNIIPEFLGLLKGTIDSSDIPLNVSRSALQGDPNIKKISNYIVKKVAESLKKLYVSDRERYEQVWEDISVFVKYGVISDTKFDDLMRSKVLYKSLDGKLLTFKEYEEAIPESFKEKLKGKIITCEKEKTDQSLKEQLKSESIPAIEVDNYIDPHFTQHVEIQKKDDLEIRFVSIDSEFENLFEGQSDSEEDKKVKSFFETVFGITPKEEKKEDEQAPAADDSNFEVEVRSMKSSAPAYIKIDQTMKRFKQMSQTMGQAQFELPIKKTLVVNPSNPLIQNALKIWEKGEKKELAEKICYHVQDLANISSEGLSQQEKEDFVGRSQQLISELSNFVV